MGKKKHIFISASILAAIAVAAACSSGTTVSECKTGSTDCNGVCTVVARDPENCGACGKKCGAGEVCSQGACALSCAGGTTACSASCVDTKSDANNCGGCGTKCTGGQVCNAGKCASSCTAPTTACGSSCVNTQTDPANCGSCGNACASGLFCVNGSCGLTCQKGLTACPRYKPPVDGGVSDAAPSDASSDAAPSDAGTGDLLCVDLAVDPLNCGACGNSCGFGAICKAGGDGGATCVANCGDGIVGVGELCDDGNTIDNDACTNSCKLGVLTVAGSQRAQIKTALAKLGETFTEYTTADWFPAPAGGILIESNDGSAAPPDYSTTLNAGGHVMWIGGSGIPAYTAALSTYLATDGTSAWHQSSACSPDYTGGSHPILQFMPATYEFANQGSSFHMVHFAAVQPPGAVLLGKNCEAAPNNTMATRVYGTKGTFTHVNYSIGGAYINATDETSFLVPLLKGYLKYIRSPH